jgi:hypothetical protein
MAATADRRTEDRTTKNRVADPPRAAGASPNRVADRVDRRRRPDGTGLGTEFAWP